MIGREKAFFFFFLAFYALAGPIFTFLNLNDELFFKREKSPLHINTGVVAALQHLLGELIRQLRD